MNTELRHTEYGIGKAPNEGWKPSFVDVPGLNILPVDYNLLKNKP